MNTDVDAAAVFQLLKASASQSDILAILKTIHHLSPSPSDPDWIHAEAYAYILLGDARKALFLLQNAISCIDSLPLTWLLLGLAYRKLGNHDENALAAYLKADGLLPGQADTLYNIANVMADIGDVSAYQYYFRSLSVNPIQSMAWHNIYFLLIDLNLNVFAYVALNVSACLDPLVADIWCNIGLKYIDLAHPLKAKKAFEIALSIDPSHKNSCSNIGNILIDSLKVSQALPYLKLGSGHDSKSLLNFALCCLLLGDFKDGLQAYESRLSSISIPIKSPRLTSFSQIINSSDELIIWAEQGIGDSIMFVRYLLMLNAKKIKWHLYCPDSLLHLFRNCFSSLGTVSPLDLLPITSSNFNIPLLSLPHLFQTDLSTIPGICPYINVLEPPSAPFLVSPPAGGISIGLVWSSDPSNVKMYKNKSIGLSLLMPCFEPLLNLGLVHVHSFQVGEDADQLIPWSQHQYVTDWRSNLSNFYDTARLVAQMDLIVSVDTAVAHLAGSMNIPVWLLLAANADFRWLLNCSDSPWYPNTMRLFRQRSPGDWNSVTAQICDCLDSLCLLDLKSLSSLKKS